MSSKMILYFFPANLFRFVLIGKPCHVLQPSGTIFLSSAGKHSSPPPSSFSSSSSSSLPSCHQQIKTVAQALAREINPEGVAGVAGGFAQLTGGHVGVSGLSVRTLQGCGASQLFKVKENLLRLRFLRQCRYAEGTIV